MGNKKSRGRPKQEKTLVLRHYYIDPVQDVKLKQLANSLEVAVADLVRNAISDYLEKEEAIRTAYKTEININ